MKKLLICLLIFVGAIFISCNFVINATTTKTVPEQPMIQTEPLSLIVEAPAPSTNILPEEEPAPTPEQEPLATREEIELLALCTMAEAEGECEQGQRLVIARTRSLRSSGRKTSMQVCTATVLPAAMLWTSW